jgi:hypothetical protein
LHSRKGWAGLRLVEFRLRGVAMGQKLLKFVSVEQEMPDKRPAEERRHDFAEIYARFDPAAAKTQA